MTRFFPTSGQSEVPLDVEVVVEFNEPIRPRTAAGAGSILFEGETPVSGQLFTERARLRFRPAQPLKPGTAYRIEVGNYEDEAGNPVAPPTSASFTTLIPPPTTQPFRLLNSSIPDGAQNQPLQPRIELRFNLPLESRTLSATLRSERAQFPIQIQLLTPQSVLISPQSPLPGGTSFTLDFSAFRGVGGEGAPEPSQIRFTTEVEVDRTPPRVVASNPAREASGVPIQPVITVSFDERIRQARPLGSVVRDPRSGQFLTGALTFQPDGPRWCSNSNAH